MRSKDRFHEIDSALKELQESITRIEGMDTDELARKVSMFREEIYAGISRWSSIELARHSGRPVLDDYLSGIFRDFTELRGDRIGEDDAAIKGGLAFLDDVPVVVVGHKKRSSRGKDHARYRYGMASPSGHHKAMRLMKLAEKFGRPLITFVDTPGAYPAPETEYRGQAFSIAQCISTLASLKTPVIVCIIGEAGSGGALALGFGDRIIMLENAFYSAISPEAFSSILYGDDSNKEQAADALKGSGRDLASEGIVDHLIKEPVGGAQNDPAAVVEATGQVLRRCVSELLKMDREEIMRQRAAVIERLLPSKG
ncbi:MAG TPA: carboxyl transferase domain-containing protein [Deltaproteobacteria bacterium]|nr:carboxyl transferase domain-containing protein [Deltaproteobacteria bacterium]HPX19824.1 carboxyl transferase domain-containing protein [Deltaproteobacteria bacterium]